MRVSLVTLLCLASVFSVAQQSPAAASDGNVKANSQPAKPKTAEDTAMQAEQSQRMLGVVPMFGVTSRQNARPLTAPEKLHLWAKTAFDPFEGAAIGLQAGLSQWQNEFPEYGQGAAGYGKRYGAALADGMSSGFFSNAFYPILLKEDPRFF